MNIIYNSAKSGHLAFRKGNLTANSEDLLVKSTKRIIITGANGFIGSYTTLLFESLGYRVVPCSRREAREHDLSLLPIRTKTVKLDVADTNAFRELCKTENVTHIVHIAQPRREENPEVLNFSYRVMLNILETAKEMNIQRVVFTSSGAVYGQLRKKDHGLIKEDDLVPIYPTFIYRSSKIIGEWLGDFYARYHGVSFVALRISSVYGPGQAKGIGGAIKNGILGRECRPYLTRIPDDLIFVKDVAQAIRLACFCERPNSRAYNIASGRSYLEQDLIGAIQRHLPEMPFKIGKHPNATTTNVYRQRDILDVTLARDELGFVPEYDLDRGVAEIARWARDEKKRLS